MLVVQYLPRKGWSLGHQRLGLGLWWDLGRLVLSNLRLLRLWRRLVVLRVVHLLQLLG